MEDVMNNESQEERDPIIIATEAVHKALKPLDAEARAKVLSAARSLLGIAEVEAPTFAKVRRPVSLVELKQEKQPGTNAQRIALYAYYRERFEGVARFSRGDLREYFEKAKDSQPGKNYARDFEKAMEKGWINEDGSNSYITSKGVEAVEAGFSGERKRTRHR
jgi:hypothetical protein